MFESGTEPPSEAKGFEHTIRTRLTPDTCGCPFNFKKVFLTCWRCPECGEEIKPGTFKVETVMRDYPQVLTVMLGDYGVNSVPELFKQSWEGDKQLEKDLKDGRAKMMKVKDIPFDRKETRKTT